MAWVLVNRVALAGASAVGVLRPMLGLVPASRSGLGAYRDERLRRLVAHAYARVPYNRELFDRHGVRPAEVRGVADLARIPITSRADLRALRSFGLRARDRRVAVFPPRSVHPRDNKVLARLLAAAGLSRRSVVDAYLDPAKVAARLRRLQPDVITGYPGVLARVAAVMGEGHRLGGWPRLIMTGAEVLTPDLRRRIAEGFGGRVFDTYGTHEFNLVAWECRETGEYHTCDDSLILEILRDGRPVEPGERGELVVDRLRAAMGGVLGTGVAIDVRLVAEIRVEASGKFRAPRSLVHSAYDGIDWEARR